MQPLQRNCDASDAGRSATPRLPVARPRAVHPLPSAAAQRGTHTELGLAIAYGKPVLIFASSASRFASNATCAFYFHPAVRLRRVLKQEETRIAVMEACVVQHFASLSVQQTGPDFTCW